MTRDLRGLARARWRWRTRGADQFNVASSSSLASPCTKRCTIGSAWWTALPDNPTADVYAQSVVAALTSYLARATSQGQAFKDFEAFAAASEIKHHPDDWLPPRLFKQAVETAQTMTIDGATFTLVAEKGQDAAGAVRAERRDEGDGEVHGSRRARSVGASELGLTDEDRMRGAPTQSEMSIQLDNNGAGRLTLEMGRGAGINSLNQQLIRGVC